MKKNKKWFSIVIALWLVLLINLLALSILEYIIPFSKNTKWIENSSASYYKANSWIEDALFKIKNNPLWTESSKNLDSSLVSDYSYKVKANGSILPPIWEWNSEYNKNWNKISSWQPIQIEIWNQSFSFSSFIFAFKIPNIDWTNKYLSWTNLPIINWQISWEKNTLNAYTWSYIKWSQICSSNENFSDCSINFSNPPLYWQDLNDNVETINDFYWDWVTWYCWTWSWCILKLSIINKLEDINWINIPFLEWQIKNSSNPPQTIPLRYSIINSSWKSYWYKKNLEIKVPQDTVIEAFDFTVFQ